MTDRKTAKYGITVFLGVLAGAIVGLFLAPKKGKALRQDFRKNLKEIQSLLKEENREKTVKDIFGKANVESRLIYKKSKEILALKLSELRTGFSKINKKKYQRIVAEVVEDVAQEKRMPKEILKKLQKYLESDFKKMKRKPTMKKRGLSHLSPKPR